jgi:site-specific DNA-methyltransferase (adenine-specific)
MSLNPGMMSSNKQDWTTPIELFNELNKEFNFDCDLFASHKNALCDCYFTEQTNALDIHLPWHKTNFANPPYDTKIQNAAFKRAHEEALKGNTTVMLIPARTDTKRFHDYVFKHNYEIRFIKGRLKFSNSKNPAPFPSCIIIFKG